MRPLPMFMTFAGGTAELTDALAGVEFARAWANRNSFEQQPWIGVAGGLAGFAGVDSPVTQAFGLGFSGEVAESEIVRMEEFYRELGIEDFYRRKSGDVKLPAVAGEGADDVRVRGRSRIVAMSFCEPRSWKRILSS